MDSPTTRLRLNIRHNPQRDGRAQASAKAIPTTTNPAKAEQARALRFDDVIDLSAESLPDEVARLTGGRVVDIVIDSVGGALKGHALATLASGGVLASLGYSAGPKTTIDVTDLIWKRASMTSGRVKPVVE